MVVESPLPGMLMRTGPSAEELVVHVPSPEKAAVPPTIAAPTPSAEPPAPSPKVTIERRDTVWADIQEMTGAFAKSFPSVVFPTLSIPQCSPRSEQIKARMASALEASSTDLLRDLLPESAPGGEQKAHTTNKSKSSSTLDSYQTDPSIGVSHESAREATEDELMQMRRLASWDTVGTYGTIGTIASNTLLYDDDGNLIDPRLIGKSRLPSGRKRLVKFAYPPVSSLRQCPRAPEEDLANLFFTERELDQYEEDRISTFVADDVEIVAIASSLSDMEPEFTEEVEADDDTDRSLGTPDASPRPSRNLSTRPATPFRRRPRQQPSTPLSGATTGQDAESASGNSGEKASDYSAPVTDSPSNIRSPRKHHDSSSSLQRSSNKRLIKSVQIYLRERSSGHHSPR